MSKERPTSQVLPIVALVLAWLIPGAGHICLNHLARGIIIFLVIGGLFWAGVAMGGVMTVDSFNERWWFIAEMMTGAHGLISWQRQQQLYNTYRASLETNEEYGRLVQAHPGDVQATQQKYFDQMQQRDGVALVSPMDTVARAYSGVAGLLNLMCIFDAVLLALTGRVGEPLPVPSPAAKDEGN